MQAIILSSMKNWFRVEDVLQTHDLMPESIAQAKPALWVETVKTVDNVDTHRIGHVHMAGSDKKALFEDLVAVGAQTFFILDTDSVQSFVEELVSSRSLALIGVWDGRSYDHPG